MANFSQAGRPSEVKTTTPNIVVSDVVSAECNFDPEILYHVGGANRFPRYTIGNDNTTVVLRTTDVACLGWVQGMAVAGLQVKFQGTAPALDSSGAISGQAAGTIGYTISSAVVSKGPKLVNQSTGNAMEYEIEFRACIKESDGTEPTITFDVSLAS